MPSHSRARGLVPLAILAFLLALVVPIAADDAIELHPERAAPTVSGSFAEGGASLWFVELASPPAVRGTPRSTLDREHGAFRAAAARASLAYSERFAFTTLWNGLSIEAALSTVGAIARLPGVRAIYPVDVVPVPAGPTSGTELAHALAMTGADIAQSELGLSGAGVRVAVMDTGIDYHHPDLGGCFGTGCRVITGHDFVGDSFNASGTTNRQLRPRPDPDPDDCNGHGTHVAGIVGASGDPATGGARGVAPDVVFGAYRVFGCEGSTTADIMIAAMERALADGMHVLNMSIGSAFQWPSYPTATASNNLVDAGMVVVASIGNNGASGVYSTGAPGNGDKVIGVASFDNSHVVLNTFTVTPADLTIGYGNAAAAPPAPTTGSLPLAKSGTPDVNNDACNVAGASPFTAGQFSGQAVLIRRGTCTFHEKAVNAQNAGAAAVVLYNNLPGLFSPTVAGSTEITIPVVAISDTDGVAVNNAIEAEPQTLNWTDETGTFLNPTGGLISSFSSYGHAPDLSLKPDVGAPGGLIRSTWPLELGAYATISGTSMSSPHVAGAVALYLEAHPGTAAADVRTNLQNSADPKNWQGNPGLRFLDQVHRQGAGMLDIPGAVQAGTRLSLGKIALGEMAAGASVVRQLTLTNTGSDAVTYDLTHQPALGTHGSTFTPGANTAFATVSFSPASITVPAGGSGTVAVSITAPGGTLTNLQFGGYIRAVGEGTSYRVPYAGFRGDYQAIPALTSGGDAGFPWLAKRVSTETNTISDWEKQEDGAVYTLRQADVPWVLFHLDHQVSRLTIDVRDADGALWARLIDVADFGRSSAAASFFALQWDGMAPSPTDRSVKVANNASFSFRITVLRALGDSTNAAHIETWDSPVFVINRGARN
ncbi:MAG: S8 family serine peptidase [Candidatus Limnocylindria bacterium]